MADHRAALVLSAAVAAVSLAAVASRISSERKLPAARPVPAAAPVCGPGRCDPGCYAGRPYCLKVCTANVGAASCFDDCLGDAVCAAPGYDPYEAYRRLTPERLAALSAGKKTYFGGEPPPSADVGEGLNPKLK